MSASEKLGIAAAVAGLGAFGGLAAAGVARVVTRSSRDESDDPCAGVDFTEIYADDASSVRADDGVVLAVRTVHLGGLDADAEPELTVIFTHGLSLRMASWHFQRFALAGSWANRRIRMVFFDQRGHGRSAAAPPETCTIAQISDDVAAVMRTVAPRGPVVLVGHSMGAMALMALARRRAELFGPDGQVVGVACVAAAARGLTETGLARGLGNPLVGVFRAAVRHAPSVVEAGRGVTRMILEPMLGAGSFGPDFHSRTADRVVAKMIQHTPISTVVNFLNALEQHDETEGLPVLAQVPTAVVCGSVDMITPLPKSLHMYRSLGADSRLDVVEGAGHMVLIQTPERVTDAIADLVDRVSPARSRSPRYASVRGHR
ncbi:MAG: alpha/beta hydrolase [Gordonia sp. (in: high G+C Gram-positive bacteria)]